MARITFKEMNLRSETLALIEQCNRIIIEYQQKGMRLTLRQLYYKLIARDLFPEHRRWTWTGKKWQRDEKGTKNAQPNYKWLSETLTDGRYAGYVDWDAIEDRVRLPHRASQFDSFEDLLQSAIDSYRLPRWADQPYYTELWIEKDALSGVLTPIANELHIILMVNRGYSSASAMFDSAMRFRHWQGEGKKLKLFYMGDFDPSGEDMVRDIGDRLEEFGVRGLDVQKLALTWDQIEEFQPPPSPAKLLDPRSKKYIEEHGDDSWELDALDPELLVDLVRDAVKPLIDQKKLKAILKKENQGKAKLRKMMKKQKK